MSRRFSGAGPWGDDGLSRTRLTPVLDGDLVRRLDVGQACYVHRGGVTFLQVKRLTGRQAEIGSGVGVRAPGAGMPASAAVSPVSPVSLAAWPASGGGDGPPTAPLPVAGTAAGVWPGGPAPVPVRPASGPALPDVGEVLDEAFGERRG